MREGPRAIEIGAAEFGEHRVRIAGLVDDERALPMVSANNNIAPAPFAVPPSAPDEIARLNLGNDVRVALEGARVVSGGLLDALCEVVVGPPYIVRFTVRGKHGVSLNPQRGGGWRSCSVRVRGKSQRTKGVLSLWTRDIHECAVVYTDGPAVMAIIDSWGLSNLDRNRLMHALNGNTREFVCSCSRVVRYTQTELSKFRHNNEILCPDCWREAKDMVRLRCSMCSQWFVSKPDQEICPLCSELDAFIDQDTQEKVTEALISTKSRKRDKSQDCAHPKEGTKKVSFDDEQPAPLVQPQPDLPGGPYDSLLNGQATCPVIVGIWGRDLLPLDDRDVLHYGGIETPMPGDYVLTCEFQELSGHCGHHHGYTRLGHRYQRVSFCGREASAADWLWDPVPVSVLRSRDGEMRTYHAVQVCTMDKSCPPVSLFRLHESVASPLNPRHRFDSFDHRGIRYECFRGMQTTMLSIAGDRRYIASNISGEVARYFVGENSNRVCASHILGHLKNCDRVSHDDMTHLIRYHSAKHESTLIGYTRSLEGDPSVHRAVAAERAGRASFWDVWQEFWDDCGDRLYSTTVYRVVLAVMLGFLLSCFVASFATPGHMVYSVWNKSKCAIPICKGDMFGVDFDKLGIKCARFDLINGTIKFAGQPRWRDHMFEEVWTDEPPREWRRFCGSNEQPSNMYAKQLRYWSRVMYFIFAFVMDVFVLPFIEEAAKRVIPLAWLMIPMVELTFVGPRHIPAVFMHIIAADLRFQRAVFVHSAFNFLALGHWDWILGMCVSWGLSLDYMAPLLNRAESIYAVPLWFQDYAAPFLVAFVEPIFHWDGHFTPGSVWNLGAGALGLLGFTAPLGEFSVFKKISLPEHRGKLFTRPNSNVRGKGRLMVLLPEFAPMGSFQGNQSNAIHSAMGRVLKVTPDCTASTAPLSALLDIVSARMGRVTPCEFDVWVQGFPPAKRARYTFARERLGVFGFAWFTKPFGTCTKWFKRSCFLKHEANLRQLETRTGGGFVAHADPRTIQASTDEVQVVFGPSIKAFGDRASHVFDGTAESKVSGVRVLVGFGRTKADVARITRAMCESGEPGVVDCGDDAMIIIERKIYAIDAKRWDAHVRPALLHLRQRFYARLGMSADALHVLRAMLKRKGVYTGLGVSFEVDGCVASGDADTLFWNTILGVVLLIDCARPGDFQGFNDAAFRYGIEYELAGCAARTEPSAELDFCSCLMTPAAEGWTFAPKLGRSLAKLGYSATMGKGPLLLAQKIQGLTYDLGVYPEIVAELRRPLKHLPAAGPVSDSYFPVGKSEPAGIDERREFVARRYGVCYDDVVMAVREWISAGVRGCGEVSSTVLSQLVAVDYGKRPIACELPFVQRSFQPRSWKRVGGLVIFLLALIVAAEVPDMVKKSNRKATPKPIVNNKGHKIGGRGDYTLLASMAASAAKQALAKAIPKGTFERAGANLGARMGRGLSNITGMGDYALNSAFNNNMVNRARSTAPQVVSSREFIKDWSFDGNPNFTLETFDVNPADPKVFPWLSRLASLYTKYRFKQLVLEFVSSSSEYAASVALGTMIMAPQYNIKAPLFDTKQTMEGATHAVSFKPSKNAMCGIECDPKDSNYKWYFVRNRGDMVKDVTTEFCRINVANSGTPASVPAGTTLGELWINYTVELSEPVLSSANTTLTTSLFANTLTAGYLDRDGLSLATNMSSFPGSPFTDFTYFNGTPENATYRIGMNDVMYPGVIWFKEPGLYVITVFVKNNNAFTSFPVNARIERIQNAAVYSGEAYILQYNSQPAVLAQDKLSGTWQYMIQCDSGNVGIKFTKNTNYAPLNTITPLEYYVNFSYCVRN